MSQQQTENLVRTMRTAVVQLQCNDVGDKQYNINLIEKLVGECCAEWATKADAKETAAR